MTVIRHPLQVIVYEAEWLNGQHTRAVYLAEDTGAIDKWSELMAKLAEQYGTHVARATRRVGEVFFEGEVQHIPGTVVTYGVEVTSVGRRDDWAIAENGLETEREAGDRGAWYRRAARGARVVEYRRRVLRDLA